jgi:hypothetical protein
MGEAIDFPCPVCNAAPKQNCLRINGTPMSSPHSKRRALALGVTIPTREDVSQVVALIARKAREK